MDNKKPHLIMPMGGAGSRFYKNGYAQPKPLIKISGHPFLYWSTMSIAKFVDIMDLFFVVLQQHIDEYKIDSVIKRYFPDANIIIIPSVLPGPVYTALRGIENIHDDSPIIFNDCDHMFCCNEMNQLLNRGTLNVDGALLTFESSGSQFSYVKYNDSGKIIGTVEKQVVSSHAICGAYIFSCSKLFKEMASIYVKTCPYDECFMSGVYNTLCEHGMSVGDFLLDYHVEFGTPKEYELAKDSEYFKYLM